jgi:hypothetical protein
MKDLPTRKKNYKQQIIRNKKMYATNYTNVSTRAVYQMHHTELLTVDPLIRPAEATLEGIHCINISVVNHVEDRWRMVLVGLSK